MPGFVSAPSRVGSEPGAHALAGRAVHHVGREVRGAVAVAQQLRPLHRAPVALRHPEAAEAGAQAGVHLPPAARQALAQMRGQDGGHAALLRVLPPGLQVQLEEHVGGAGDAAGHAGVVAEPRMQPAQQAVHAGKRAGRHLTPHGGVVAGQERRHLVAEGLPVGDALVAQRARRRGQVGQGGEGDAAEAGHRLQRPPGGSGAGDAGAARDVRLAGDGGPLPRQEAAAGGLADGAALVQLARVAQTIGEALRILPEGGLRVRPPHPHEANGTAGALRLADDGGDEVAPAELPVVLQPRVGIAVVDDAVFRQAPRQGAGARAARQRIGIAPRDVVVAGDEVVEDVAREALHRRGVGRVDAAVGEGARVPAQQLRVAPGLEAHRAHPGGVVLGAGDTAGDLARPGAGIGGVAPDQRLHLHHGPRGGRHAGVGAGGDVGRAVQPGDLARQLRLRLRGDPAQPGQHARLVPAGGDGAQVVHPRRLLRRLGRAGTAGASPLAGADEVRHRMHGVRVGLVAHLPRGAGEEGGLPGMALGRCRTRLLRGELLRHVRPAQPVAAPVGHAAVPPHHGGEQLLHIVVGQAGRGLLDRGGTGRDGHSVRLRSRSGRRRRPPGRGRARRRGLRRPGPTARPGLPR